MRKITAEKLAKIYGSYSDAARWVGISRQNMYNWKNRGIPKLWQNEIRRRLAVQKICR